VHLTCRLIIGNFHCKLSNKNTFNECVKYNCTVRIGILYNIGYAGATGIMHTKSCTWFCVKAHSTEVMFLRFRIYFARYRSAEGILTHINNVYGFPKAISSVFYYFLRSDRQFNFVYMFMTIK